MQLKVRLQGLSIFFQAQNLTRAVFFNFIYMWPKYFFLNFKINYIFFSYVIIFEFIITDTSLEIIYKTKRTLKTSVRVGVLCMEQLPYELRAWPESGHVGLEQQTTLPWNNCPLEQPSYNQWPRWPFLHLHLLILIWGNRVGVP